MAKALLLKITAILIFLGAVIWFYKDYQFQKKENQRQTNNLHQLRLADSLRYAQQTLNQQELQEYLKYQNATLQKALKQNGIKTNRITEVISNNYYYKDTVKSSSDVSKMINSIRLATPNEQTFTDSTQCLTIKGQLVYNGKDLQVQITNREFNNQTNAVVYWQRHQWKFLGIKTRWFGKKEFTAKVFDQCGESKIVQIKKAQ